MKTTPLQRITSVLFCLFCIAYPIAVAGVAFDVPPTFSMTWTGSALLILEGMLLVLSSLNAVTKQIGL